MKSIVCLLPLWAVCALAEAASADVYTLSLE